MNELIRPNTIAFNGTIISDFIDVGGGYLAFNIKAGNSEDFPLLLLKENLEEATSNLSINDQIIGAGMLKFFQNDWVVFVEKITRVLSNEEFEQLP